MFGEKRAGPDPRSLQNLSSNPEPEGHAPGEASLSARRGADTRGGLGSAAVRCTAQPYLAMVGGPLCCLACLSSPRVRLVCREIPYPGSTGKLCRRLCINCALKIFWSIAIFFS